MLIMSDIQQIMGMYLQIAKPIFSKDFINQNLSIRAALILYLKLLVHFPKKIIEGKDTYFGCMLGAKQQRPEGLVLKM